MRREIHAPKRGHKPNGVRQHDDQVVARLIGRLLDSCYGRRSGVEAKAVLRAFLTGGPTTILGDSAFELAQWTDSQVEALVGEFRGFFDALAALQASKHGGLVPSLQLSGNLEIGATPLHQPSREGDPAKANVDVLLTLDTTAANALRWQLAAALQQIGIGRVRACPAHLPNQPEATCGQIFLKIGKRDYCSDTCQARVNQKSWRDGESRKKRIGVKRGSHGTTKTRKR